MLIALMALAVPLVVAGASVRAVVRDVRGLNRSGRRLTDSPIDAAGVSAAGVTVIGNNITH